jgi:hypothetical protein
MAQNQSTTGPSNDKDWYNKLERIEGFTGENRPYCHEALVYYGGDAATCINGILDKTYVPKYQPKLESMQIDTMTHGRSENEAHTTTPAVINKPKLPSIEERKRKDNTAVGIKNVGNTCFASVLIQFYYSFPSFVE